MSKPNEKNEVVISPERRERMKVEPDWKMAFVAQAEINKNIKDAYVRRILELELELAKAKEHELEIRSVIPQLERQMADANDEVNSLRKQIRASKRAAKG